MTAGATPGGRATGSPATGAAGQVSIVGTPIGNAEDLSPRAAQCLAGAHVIFCEDTRRTRRLLSAVSVPAPRLVAMHQHNEAASASYAVSLAAAGARVAVVSDAGMPGVSDPGRLVVRAALEAKVRVEVVPGPSALVTALVASGMPAERFCFEGFLPRKGRERSERLRDLSGEERTTVIYEAPHRAARTLGDLLVACGPEREVTVARELTKAHEEVWRGCLADAVERAGAGEPRGEWVIVVAGARPPAAPRAAAGEVIRALEERLAAGEDRRRAVASVAVELGLPKREVYEASLGLGLDLAGDPGPPVEA
ncbi:MAG: 16S rRNA (cytidine(1402)-2'-O)-methyltransferase [Acidimicrobiales bacterium]